MNYKTLGNTGIRVSEVGFGCEFLQGKSKEFINDIINRALDAGVNIFDVFMSEPEVRSNIGAAFGSRRKEVVIQGHIGAAWVDGQYKRTRDIALCKEFIGDFLNRMNTDYIDLGMIHFIDEDKDLDKVINDGVLEYALDLKAKGTIRALGFSSHNPAVALRAVLTGHFDVMMFSLNPAFDLLPEQTDIDGLFKPESYQNNPILGMNPVRDELYKTCESMGVGITVMKALGGGSLLDGKTSPFGIPLSVTQLMHYALTRPGVAAVLPGAQTFEELDAVLHYVTATSEELDYSPILSTTPAYSLKGKCMYCNHCLPCPSEIDIAAVNKYLDMALLHDTPPATIKEHYEALPHTAKDCISCGQCETRCPFSVPVIEKMEKAVSVFEI